MEFIEFKIFLLNRLMFMLLEIFFFVKFVKIDKIVVFVLFIVIMFFYCNYIMVGF